MERKEVSETYNVRRVSFWPWLRTKHVIVLRRDENDRSNGMYGTLDGETILNMDGQRSSYKSPKGETTIITKTRKIRVNIPLSLLLHGIGLYSVEDVYDQICGNLSSHPNWSWDA